MNKLSLLTVLIVSVFSMISCTKKEELNEKTLNLVVGSEVKGMDPIYSNDRYSSNETARVYESLLDYNYLKRPYQLAPNLAESMPEVSNNGLTYTFKIKKGVTFHDDKAFPGGKGRELVAEDFVYSIKRLADPKLQGLGWWTIDGKIKGLNEWREKNTKAETVNYDEVVEGMKALDSHTLQFTLVKPFPQFLYSLAMTFTSAVAKEVVDFYGTEFLNHPVGTGPFILPVFKQTNRIEYVKNPNYREKTFPCEASEEFEKIAKEYCGKKLPLVEKVVVNIIKEDQPRWLNFQKGNLDYIGIPKDNFDAAVTPTNQLATDLSSKGIDLLIQPSLDVTYTAFNLDLDLLKNKKLRQALSLAYDVETANKLFYNNRALPAQSLVPPGIAGYEKDFKNSYRGHGKEEEVARAKKLLAEAGYPEGKGLKELTYDCPSSTVSRQIGEYTKQQFAKIGVKLRVVQNTWPELQKKIDKRQVELWGIAWGADYPDAENFLQLLYGPNRVPGANGSGYDNPAFNRLYESASTMQDTPERTALYEKMTRMAAEEMPWIYGVHRQNYVLKHSWLKNYVITDFEAGTEKYLDVDLAAKKVALEKL